MLLTALGRLLMVPVNGGSGENSSDSSEDDDDERGGGGGGEQDGGGDDGNRTSGRDRDPNPTAAGPGHGGGDGDVDGDDADPERPRPRSVRFREDEDDEYHVDGDEESAETLGSGGGGVIGVGGVDASLAAAAGQEMAPPSPSPSRRGGADVNGDGNNDRDKSPSWPSYRPRTWTRPLLRSSGSASFFISPAHPQRNHSPTDRQRAHRDHRRRHHRRRGSPGASNNAPATPADRDPRGGDGEPGILVAFGTEQLFTAPALLLLCPFAGLVVVLTFLDQEDWNWRACLERNVRKHVYGCQGAAFAILVMLGLECAGERLVREAFGVGQTVASRVFQRELAFFLVAMGVGLAAIQDTLAEATSIFATAFGSYMIFAGSLHWSQRLPTVMVVAFLWNGLQLIVVAWVGGNVVDGRWTSNWKG